jgi:hypothetical protein
MNWCNCARQFCNATVPGGYRLVQVADPVRDGQADDYQGAVQDWHRQRAALYARLIEQEIGDGETGAFCCGASRPCNSTCVFSTWSANRAWRSLAGHPWHQQCSGAGGAAPGALQPHRRAPDRAAWATPGPGRGLSVMWW